MVCYGIFWSGQLVKCVLKCGIDQTWRRTSASLNYERFRGHTVKLKWAHFNPSHSKQVPITLRLYLIYSSSVRPTIDNIRTEMYYSWRYVWSAFIWKNQHNVTVNVLTRSFGRFVGQVGKNYVMRFKKHFVKLFQRYTEKR